MSNTKTNYCDLIAHHLCVPYERGVVTGSDIAQLFREGTFEHVDENTLKGALLHSIFECSLDQLGWGCLQAGSDMIRLNNLYSELVSKGLPRHKEWERIMYDMGVTDGTSPSL